ncbi:hypothetical protein [Chitinophaga solisilvae]|uniref:phage tailspike polysaccharide lyase family protein n=1 Tax=Chitinophaga solisilvae TaxID=1233460 RepID=UPI001369B5ED|nr:hypothetical protein [Chitinophaga solisilvae]
MTVVTLNDLRTATSLVLTEACHVLQHSLPGDGGGGVFTWDATDTVSVDNNGTIIKNINNANGRWKRVYDGRAVNVKWFGARGNGIADDTTALTQAFRYNTFIPAGRYKLTSLIIVSNDIILHCDKDAVIDISDITTDTALVFKGTVVSSSPLLADLNPGSKEINFAGSVQRGDVIRLQTKTILWNPLNSQHFKGELCEVESQAGSIRITSGIYDSYPAADTIVSVIRPVAVEINNLTIFSNSGGYRLGLRVINGRNVLLRNCTVTGVNERAFDLTECLGARVEDGTAICDNLPANGTNYGLAVNSSQDVIIHGGYYKGIRHGIATGGTFPCRNIKHIAVTVDNVNPPPEKPGTVFYPVGALDSHSNGEFFEYHQVKCLNGALLQSRNIKISDCFFRSCNYRSCLEFYPEVSGGYYTLNNVSFENLIDNCAVAVLAAREGNTLDMLAMNNLTAIVAGDGVQPAVYNIDQSAGAFHLKQVQISDLSATVLKDGLPALKKHLFAIGRGTNGISVGSLTLSSSYLSCDKQNWGVYYIRVQRGELNISRCLMSSIVTQDASFLLSYTPATNVTFSENVMDGGNQFNFYQFLGMGTLRLSQNIIRNSTRSGVMVNNVPLFIASDNIISNVTSPFEITNVEKFVTGINQWGNYVLYADNAPSTGVWKAGDQVIHKAPAAGSQKGWRCIASGTPGTWKAEGAL